MPSPVRSAQLAPEKARSRVARRRLVESVLVGALSLHMLTQPALAEGFSLEDEMQQWLPKQKPTSDQVKLELLAKERAQKIAYHPALGLVTLGLMTGTAYTGHSMLGGYELYYKNLHRGFVGATLASYLATGYLAVTAPKPFDAHKERLDTTAVHRALFWLHALGMASALTTGFLNEWGEDNGVQVMPKHAALGYATYGLIGASAVVMALDF